MNKESIDKAIEDYRLALHESIDSRQAEIEAQKRTIRAHHLMVQARDILHGLELEQY